LALKANLITFHETIFPLVKGIGLQQNKKPNYFLDPNSPLKKRSKKLLDYE
jgi:hypothetical protein